ncbi:hypothetical protein [Lapillicoccus sp.]|uniref:hypothetical protein n=1 Tax=Lapillicoccus sp. TaxID=1909287 RepID=UPI003264EA2B
MPGQLSSGPGWHVDSAGGTSYLYVTEEGAVLDALDINLCVKVFANNVTIRRSRIACAGTYVLVAADLPTAYTGLTLTDVEMDGLSQPASESIAVLATTGARYTRLDIHGMASSGPRLTTDDVLEDSYVHDFVCAPPLHQAGISANDGGSRIVVRHNAFDIDPRGGCTTASWEIALDFGTYDTVTTEENLFDGGAYCVYAGVLAPGSQFPVATNIRFSRNVFGRKYSPECGEFGPVAQYADGGGNVWTDNTWGPGGAADAQHRTGDLVSP